ncbi:hypothetical protein AAA439_13000 [Lactobacillus crispatus]|uniref:Uncharacterized protein n=1 Tax=Lactobacillus crispatus FB077-07 TaxID=883092 RepID=K1LZL1_9LACO|nr:hypothetical protein [Lactobacillus crispatus]EKB62215.1 hypothetical protein HMPREF9249_02438 [Lactobacillus crispatus FB077-07]CPR62665.1 Uncharacterised protein [Chlamydia trachomatis]
MTKEQDKELSKKVVEDEVRNSIYTMSIDETGGYKYKQLAHYEVEKDF